MKQLMTPSSHVNRALSRTTRTTLITLTTLMILSFISSGCADRPKTAPTDFQELTSFIYEHMLDEDPEALQLGVENMYQWLNENTKAVQRGYTVKRLSREAIATTGKSSNPKDLIGGAALTSHDHQVDALSRALGVDSVRETNGDAYVSYKRTYEGGIEAGECFARRDCDRLEGDSRSTAEWGPFEVKYDTHVQFRWVNTKYGPVMLHRSFMNKKPEVSLDIVDVKQVYYLGIVFPPLKPTGSVTSEVEDMAGEMAQTEEAGEMASEMTGEMTQGGEAGGVAGEMASEMAGEEEEFEATELNVDLDEAVIPSANSWGASALLQVNWIDVDYGILPISEDRALEMLVESIIDVAVAIEKWMDKTYQ